MNPSGKPLKTRSISSLYEATEPVTVETSDKTEPQQLHSSSGTGEPPTLKGEPLTVETSDKTELQQLHSSSGTGELPTLKGEPQPKVVTKCLNCNKKIPSSSRDGVMGQSTLCKTCSFRLGTTGRIHPTRGSLRPSSYPKSDTHEPEKVMKKSIRRATTGEASGSKRGNQSPKEVRECLHCKSTKTPRWKKGPEGPATLCSACGYQYKNGNLYPEYRPKNSPTYNPSLHSNTKKGVMIKRMCNDKIGGALGINKDPPPSPPKGSGDIKVN